MISHWIPLATCVVILSVAGCVDKDSSPVTVEEYDIVDSEPAEVPEKTADPESAPPVITTVEGRILIDDEAVSGLQVLFEPENGESAFGVTDAKGHFKLHNGDSQSSIQPGNYRVRITVPSDSKSKVRLPVRYNEETSLTASISPGSNIPDFDLGIDRLDFELISE